MSPKIPSEIELYIKEVAERTEERYKKLIDKPMISLMEKVLIKITALKTTQEILKKYDRFMTEAEKEVIYNDVLYGKCVDSITNVAAAMQIELSEEVIEKTASHLLYDITSGMFSNTNVLDAIEETLEEIKAEESADSDEYDFY